MPVVLHLVDDSEPHELRWAAGPLLARPAFSSWSMHVAALEGSRRNYSWTGASSWSRIPAGFAMPFFQGLGIVRAVRSCRADLIHTWSWKALRAALAATGGTVPIVWTCWDPHIAPNQARLFPVLNSYGNIGVLCLSGQVQRRLVERGLPMERSVVVRPGVDFATINRFKRRQEVRRRLELSDGAALIFMPPWPEDRDGAELGLWVAAVAKRFLPALHLLLYEGSQVHNRLLQRARLFPLESSWVRLVESDLSVEELVSTVDLLLVCAAGDISTTPVAWAMAASVPVLGCATYSLAELIADGQNGHLVHPNEPMVTAAKILKVIQNRDQDVGLRDRARSQIFETCGLTRYVEQVRHAYENLLAGREIGEAIHDSALDL